MISSNSINNLEDLDHKILKLDEFINKEIGKREIIQSQLKQSENELIDLDKNIELLEKVILLYQRTSEFARGQAKSQIEVLVTNCLQFVFETDIRFTIEMQELRSKASAEFYVTSQSNDLEIRTKPELSRGGGVVDIVSLALRVAFLQITKPRVEGPLILDEPAKHVSEDYIFNVGEFLKQSSDIFNRQIIMITHNQHLAALADTAYNVRIQGTTSIITKAEI